MFRTHMLPMMCAAGILCSGGGALAQTIYKQVDTTGRAMFTDQPAAGIVVPYDTFPGHEGGSALPSRSANKALFSNSAMTSMNAATIDLNEATRRLLQARQNRQEGMEALPGEQAGSAGVSAMNKRYQRRQRKLEREVVAAELRSHETALARSALSRSDGKTDPIKLAQP
jgi:predicted RNA-binding Zn ribbon-like protein